MVGPGAHFLRIRTILLDCCAYTVLHKCKWFLLSFLALVLTMAIDLDVGTGAFPDVC
jgi:hypothetical protein